jgi:hypothetical protein
VSFRCVASGIAAVRRWNDCVRFWQKSKAGEHTSDKKWQNCCFTLNQWIHGSSFLVPAVLVLRIAGLEEART